MIYIVPIEACRRSFFGGDRIEIAYVQTKTMFGVLFLELKQIIQYENSWTGTSYFEKSSQNALFQGVFFCHFSLFYYRSLVSPNIPTYSKDALFLDKSLWN